MARDTVRTLALVLVVLATIGPGIIVADAAAAQENNSTSTDDADEFEDDLTLEDLRESGTSYDDTPDSVRMSDGHMWWVVHWPADALFASPGDPEDNSWQYLSPDDRVDRNSVHLRTIHTDDSTESVTAVVATYKVEERENSENVTETVATDVRVDEHELRFGPGWPMLEVPLRQADETREVALWLVDEDGEPIDGARWTFEHESVATTQSANISTEGDYLSRVAMEFLLPIFVGSFVVGGIAKRAIDLAGYGPAWGYAKWIALLTAGIGTIVVSQFSTLAELLVMAPVILAAFIVALVGVIVLETYSDGLRRVLFVRPVLQAGKSPTGKDSVDMHIADVEEELVVEMGRGPPAVVRRGLLPFLARCFGATARLEGAQGMEMSTKLPSSKWDELIFVDPKADETIEYDAEGWSLEVPSIETREDALKLVVIGLAIAGGVAAVGMALAWSWAIALGALATVAVCATATGGYARIEPAPGHGRAAYISMLYLATELDDAETIDEARETIIELQASSQKDVDEALEAQDATLVEEMFGADVDRQLETGEPTTSATSSSSSERDSDGEADDRTEVVADD